TLRALGVSRGELFRALVLEGLLLGVVGTTLGLGLGVALARGLLGLVARTINDLYFAVTVRELIVPPGTLLRGGLLGVGATLFGSAGPALEATAAAPRSVMSRAALEARVRRGAPRAALAGLGVIGAGAGVIAVSRQSLPWSYVGLFGFVLGSALLTPAAVL